MGNASNAFDFTETLATFLASAISDGTYDDILAVLKFDQVGQEALASQVDSAAGQLWSNVVDDYIQATYPSFYLSTKVWRVANAAARDALGSDDSLAVDDIGYTEDTNQLWYVVSVDGAAASTWAALPAATLAAVLAQGNATGGTDLQLTAGDDLLVGDSAVLNDPGGAGRLAGVSIASMSGGALDVEDGTAGGEASLTGGSGLSGGTSGARALVQGGAGDGAGDGGDVDLLPGGTTSGRVGAVRTAGAFAITVIVSDTFVAASVNDYDPGGTWPATNVLRLTMNAGGTTITGLDSTGVATSELILLFNIDGTDSLTISHDDAASTAENRILGENNANVTVRPNGSVWLWYDATSSRWRTR